MSFSLKRLSFALIASFFMMQPVLAAETRQIQTIENGDYFGFDLRTEKNLSLDQCKSTCLGDNNCRAFTYNQKAQWCFLKSDYNQLNAAAGAIAGKVVNPDSAPDIGAPPHLTYVGDNIFEETRRLKTYLEQADHGDTGLSDWLKIAQDALKNGDPRNATEALKHAAGISSDDSRVWNALAQAILNTETDNSEERAKYRRDASSSALNAYLTSRSTNNRADALASLATALERRDYDRPALQAYDASLNLANSASVRALYEDLRARKGFRIVDHSVDNDSASPRICAQFSEDLVKNGVDYSSFIKVDNQAPKAVEAKERQICVEGLSHGQNYQLSFRAGLPSSVGETLSSTVVLNVYVQDRAASVRFTGDSFVLPSTARRGIPLVSVNMSTAKIKLYRVGDRSLAQLLSGYQFLRQLDGYDVGSVVDQMGEPVWQGEIEVADNQLNKEATTSFPIDEALPERKPGVYIMTAEPADKNGDTYDTVATQWFVVSDIGLATYTGQDGLHVFARSLGSAKPVADVKLTLLARNNEILGEAVTDAQGKATFNPGLSRGTDGMAPAVLMASQSDTDFVFLDMTRPGFDLSDRGVTGRPTPESLDVMSWTERGIYRAGETVHVAALARDDKADAVEKLPLTFIFRRPDGAEDRRLVVDSNSAGGYAVDLTLMPNAMLGTWTVSVYTDPKQSAVSSQMFLVEDFVPDRIEFDLTADKSEIMAGETAELNVDGRFLYGAPAAGLALEGDVTVATSRKWDRFKSYYFGLADEQEGETTRTALNDLSNADESGKSTIPVVINDLPSTTRLLTAHINVRMRESGGRAVERSVDLTIKPQGTMIGIRPDFSGDEVPQGGTAKFSLLASNANGERISLENAQWSLMKIERNYQWYRSGSSWNYEPVTFTKSVANGEINIDENDDATLSLPVDWGRYRLEIESADASNAVTSYEFDAGWYVSSTSTETPDGLEIALDKEQYAIGDTAKLNVSPRFAGEMLITIGTEKLIKIINVSVPEKGLVVDIPVDENFGAGTYVTATLYRAGSATESRMPARAIGLKWLKVDPEQRSLSVELATPEKTEPRSTLSLPVNVANAGGQQAYVMVAAVDVGILNLTRYKAPNPEGWFFGQRQLGLEMRDIYGRLIDGSLGVTGKLRTGGDGGNMGAQGSPPTEKLLALFSGIVELDSEGKAIIDFELPQFNGTARIMAVAWTKSALGHAEKDVIIRDPLVITAGTPRFMAPGDMSTIRFDIANTDAPDGDYQLNLETSDNLNISDDAAHQIVTLQGGKRISVAVPLEAQASGDGLVTIRIANDSGIMAEQVLNLNVRPVDLPITSRYVVDLSAGQGLKLDAELLSQNLLDGAHVSVDVSRNAAFDVTSMLMALDRYPYGCTEQTTSRALPLLYLQEMAANTKDAISTEDQDAVKTRVQDAIYRVLNFQSSSGSFGLWGPGSNDPWLDAYVTDFLTRAREKDYIVPERALISALNNLQNTLSYNTNIQEHGNEIAYALYVLARNKKASVGDLRYYADTQLEAFESPMAVAQLAAALALYGDQPRSESTFEAALNFSKLTPNHNYNRVDYGSRLRDGAAVLALAAETTPMPKIVPELVKLVGQMRQQSQYLSTQDQAWMLLAARGLQENNSSIKLDVDGTIYDGQFSQRYSGVALEQSPVNINNQSSDPVQAVITAVAPPAQSLPAGGDGFNIQRTYYTLDGEETNITSVEQNQRFVAVLQVDDLQSWASRVLVTDLLPAGFEIDNPRLVSSADLVNFSWLDRTEAAHLEFRNDRFVAAFDRDSGAKKQITLAYVVRAVTPGIYTHPAATVEDMYRPQFSARTSTGMMEVVTP
ncbi:MG2 domain-containing protein [Paenochrobactrum sp. BZR 588]|uniref:alpha-2-macroglobulin family protein n=1 Tax=unclassified Paenochrobactrum TaxID=2639760 RepID=UPI0038543226